MNIKVPDSLEAIDKSLSKRGICGDIRRGLSMAIIVLLTSLVTFVSVKIDQILPIFLMTALPLSWALVHRLFNHLGWLSNMYLLVGVMFDIQLYLNRYDLNKKGADKNVQ